MRFITGRLFKSLLFRVDKDIKKTIYKNETFLKSEWSFLEKSIVLWSTCYQKYIALLTFLLILILINLIAWKSYITPFGQEYFPHWRNLIEWQGIFLAGQLTIVGVVYPLVISLISVLFQNKSAKKVIFPIYQKYSGFMFAGLSGLSLSIFIIAGYFLRVILDDSTYLAICISSGLWLTANILLTAWFFVTTFLMLDERLRDRLVIRFSIHEACESDIRNRMQYLLIQNADSQGLLIKPGNGNLDVDVHLFPDESFNEVTRTVDKDKVITDIRYRVLNFAIWLQSVIEPSLKRDKGSFVILPRRVERFHPDYTLARFKGFSINPIVKALIKLSYSFKRPDYDHEAGITTILQGFVGSAHDALRESNANNFAEAVDNIIDWHTEIAMAFSFNNDLGEQDNWLLLASSNFFSRSYFDELLSEYVKLAREAVEKIPENSRFYKEVVSLHRDIYANRDDLVKHEIRSLIQGSYYTWYLLMEWRSYSSSSSDIRVANKYEDILYDFIGAWESWLVYIRPRSKSEGELMRSYPAFISHLEYTALTIICSLRFNNYEAAGWGVDMLNKWFHEFSLDFSLDFSWDQEYSWRIELLNHLLLTKDSSDEEWKVVLNESEYNNLAAFNLSFKNASLDLRLLTACYILLKPNSENTEILGNYVKNLLSGEAIHNTGSILQNGFKLDSAGELLGAYIRHRSYRSNDNGSYSTWLSHILDSFSRVDEERRVSGRIYSGWGADDPWSMSRAYVEIAISLSTKRWGLSNNWKQVIFSTAFRYCDRKSIVSDLQEWLKISEQTEFYILFDNCQKETLISNFRESVNEIINEIKNIQQKIISDAEIDEDRLTQFGIHCSDIFKETSLPKFPLNLFKTINYDCEIDVNELYGIIIPDLRKDQVSSGVEISRATNEGKWLSNIVSRHVIREILGKIISYPVSSYYTYELLDTALSQINYMAKARENPILFVGDQSLIRYLGIAVFERDIADKFGIYRRDGFDSGYMCHIGNCEVYKSLIEIDYCLLTSKVIFEKLSFGKLTDEQYVKAKYSPKNEFTGSLTLNYWMDITLLSGEDNIRIGIKSDEDE